MKTKGGLICDDEGLIFLVFAHGDFCVKFSLLAV